MAGKGIDQIPVRAPREWSAEWFERFVREVLALADVRNAKEGTGITITAKPDEQATIGSSDDITQFLEQPFVVANTSVLDNARQLVGDGEAITVTDKGAGKNVVVALGYALSLDRLRPVDVLSVLGTPVDLAIGEGTLQAITSEENDTILRRVENNDGDDVLEWGQLTVDMVPDSELTNAKLADMAEGTIKGRQAGNGTGAPEDLTAAQALAALFADGLDEYADDSAAETGGVAVNGLYRTGSVVKIRVS